MVVAEHEIGHVVSAWGVWRGVGGDEVTACPQLSGCILLPSLPPPPSVRAVPLHHHPSILTVLPR